MGGSFAVGVLGVAPFVAGVSGFVLGVVVRVGYHPTDSSDLREATPFRGHHPKHQTPTQNINPPPETHVAEQLHPKERDLAVVT